MDGINLEERLICDTPQVSVLMMSACEDVGLAVKATRMPCEYEVLKRRVDGKPNKVVANELDISTRTVETHRVHIMQKLCVESLAHRVRLWLSAQHAQAASDADPSAQ